MTIDATRVGKRVGLPTHSRSVAFCVRRAFLLGGTLVLAPLLCGCAGTVNPQNSHTTTPPPTTLTYGISGTISPTAGGSGATVTLSGTAGATTTASSSGSYSFTGLANGTYAVTPSHTGFTFSPTVQPATVNGANITGLSFTATQVSQTFSISGTISPTAGGSGATVTLSGTAAATTTTNSSGSYSFTGLANGSYSVTPSNSGFTFSPANQSVTVNAANVTGVNFTASAQVHSVLLTWNASASSVAGYNVYRSTISNSGFTKVSSSLVNGLTYTDAAVQAATTYFYVTTAVDSNGNESADSNQASATIP